MTWPRLQPVFELMRSYPKPWWIAGGWAIDLHLGYPSRSHHDVDIAVLRQDQDTLRQYLHDWSFRKVVGGQFAPWVVGEILELPIHELHANRQQENLEFLLNESEGNRWLFRRDRAITLPLAEITRHSSSGIPYFSPEAVLLYKAKASRTHDLADFESVLQTLDTNAKEWLGAALLRCHPQHEWIERLR